MSGLPLLDVPPASPGLAPSSSRLLIVTETPSEFFSARGFELRTRRDGGLWWADLYSEGELLAARYGRGSDPESALRRARERYTQEEED